ncbi:MAG TPA: DUF3618 domain-containing protein [Gammaproteobacteria bacterium]
MSSIDSDVRSVSREDAGARGYDPLAAGTTARGRSRVARWRDDSRKEPEDLEREIDETRADVEATLEALERKFAPERLLDQTIGRVRSHGGELAGNLGHAMKRNPVPMLLASVGIAWLMMTNRRDDDAYAEADDGGGMRERLRSTRERWSGKAHAVRERWSGAHAAASERAASAKEAVRQGREGARERLERAREGLSRGGESVRAGTSRAASIARRDVARVRSGFDHLLEEQPLLLGVIGIAAGALMGAALPPSESEDRWLGEARDRALERAKRTGGEGYRRAREKAEGLARQAQSAMTEGGGASDRGDRHERERPAIAQETPPPL